MILQQKIMRDMSMRDELKPHRGNLKVKLSLVTEKAYDDV